jgi:hypothetical protein
VAQDQAAIWLGGAVAAAGIGWALMQTLDEGSAESQASEDEPKGSGQPTVVTGGGFGTGPGGAQGGLKLFQAGRGAGSGDTAAGQARASQGGAGQDGAPSRPESPGGGGIQLSRETERELVENQETAQQEALAEQRKTQQAQREAAQAQKDAAENTNIVESSIGAGFGAGPLAGPKMGAGAGLGVGAGLAATKALDESGAFDKVEDSGQEFSQAVGPTASKTVKTAATPLSVPGAVATGLVGRGDVSGNVGEAVSGTFVEDAGKAVGGLF